MRGFAVICLVLAGFCIFQLSAQSSGSCWCLSGTNVNVRSSACGSVIGSTGTGSCYTATGRSSSCYLSGTRYTYYELNYGSTRGWIANTLLTSGGNACGGGSSSGSGRPSKCADYSREAWGARPPTDGTSISKPVPFYFVHHSAGSRCHSFESCMDVVKHIQNYHMDSHGWSDIGYNFLVGDDGKVYEGRGWNKVGAHAKGWNSKAIGICMMGNFEGTLPSKEALDALKQLMQCGVDMGHVSREYKLYGHRSGGNTQCPGQALYKMLKTWPRFGYCLTGGYNCE